MLLRALLVLGAFPHPLLPIWDAPEVPELEAPTAVAAIGDSLTDTRVGGGQYLNVLKRGCPETRFDAYGVGGQQTLHMRWRFTQDVLERGKSPKRRQGYGHVIVLGGINDLASGSLQAPRIERTQRNLSAMYAMAKQEGLEVIAVTLPPWGTLRGNYDRRGDATRELNAWIVDQGRLGKVDRVVDIHPVLSCGNADELCPRYRRFGSDRVHWNPAGHAAVGQAMLAAFPACRAR